jgi:hypothetical protein
MTGPDPRRLIDPGKDFYPSPGPGSLTPGQYLADWEQVRALAGADGLLPDQPVHWPLTSAVTALEPDAELVLLGQLGELLSAVETVAAGWRERPELREFLALPPWIEPRALREPAGPRAVDYCRFDLAGEHLDRTRIFEVGGDFPGGLPTSGLLNRYWRRTEHVGRVVQGYRPALIEEPGWQIGALLDLAEARDRPAVPGERIGLLVAEELHPLPELELLRAQIRRHGGEPVTLPADHPEAADLRLALLMYPNTPFVTEPERYAPVLDRIADGELIVFNGLLGRFVGANKLTLAALSGPRFRHLFTGAQLAAVDALVPWSRKLGDGVRPEEVRDRRAELVLKAPFDAISAGVRLGREHSDAEWAGLVDSAAGQGWLVQEFVPEQSLPTEAGVFHRTLGVAFLAGRPAGLTARLSSSLRATLTPGGGIQAVFGQHVGPPG